MGNNQQKVDKSGYQDYQKLGPVKVRQINDPQGGQKMSVMEFQRPIDSQKNLNAWTHEIKQIDDPQSREILLLPQKHVFQKGGMCGSSGHVHLTYENFPYVLESEIKNRKKLNRKFLQTEMWYLLYNIIRAGNKFQKFGKKIGDVSPSNILINDDGQIKIISTCSIPNQQNNFEKIVQDKNAKVYLAPEELKQDNIVKGQYPSNIDPCKAEVFSIGLTLLSSGILQDCFGVYSTTQPRTVNEGALNNYIGMLKGNYSPYLVNTILSMIALQPNQRRKSSEIYNQLFPYQYNILDLEPFPAPNQSRFEGSSYAVNNQPIVRGQIPQDHHIQYNVPINNKSQFRPPIYSSNYQPQRGSMYPQSNVSGYRRPL